MLYFECFIGYIAKDIYKKNCNSKQYKMPAQKSVYRYWFLLNIFRGTQYKYHNFDLRTKSEVFSLSFRCEVWGKKRSYFAVKFYLKSIRRVLLRADTKYSLEKIIWKFSIYADDIFVRSLTPPIGRKYKYFLSLNCSQRIIRLQRWRSASTCVASPKALFSARRPVKNSLKITLNFFSAIN